MHRKDTSHILQKVFLTGVAVLPLFWLNRFEGVPFRVFILGTGSWGIGVMLKMIFHPLVIVPLQKRGTGVLPLSLANGVISGIFELSASAVILLLMKEKVVFDLQAVVAFGTAIGSMEALVVVFSSGDRLLEGTVLEEQARQVNNMLQNLRGRDRYVYNLFYPVLERVLAIFLHISTRGMVFVSLLTRDPLPFLAALIIFLTADGFLGTRYFLEGRLSTPKGIRLFYLYMGLLTAASMLIFMEMIRPYAAQSL